MNRIAMTLPALCRACLPLAALMLLPACSGGSGAEPPLAGAEIGGPFELIGEDGQTVRWSDFDGKYRIVYFGYAYCPDVCPNDVNFMMKGFDAFKQQHPELAAKVQPLFITIDPARDTPAVVAEFTKAFSPDLLGLTGTEAQIADTAKKFAIYYQKGEDSAGGGYLMDHSRGAYLMGPDGAPIALLPVERSPDAVATELARWVS
ncbi:SCO family protein [Croceibacterium ferulae]|uniref:SCO family protein n=1 Tax=Croceibacterium ferulae TaxID=1854641 RepID=UPI000EB3824D|nr:SCO family protein [Croceibacterium ferulae]